MGLKEQSSEGVKQNLILRSCWQGGVFGLGLMDEHKRESTLMPAAELIFASEQKIRL